MRNTILLLLVLFFVGSCINLKEPYPQINYYKLLADKSSIENIGSLDKTLMIKDLTASSEIETTHLLALWDNEHIQRYYYHRWITDAPSMITDFINNIFSKNDYFNKGVVMSSSMAVPDYILEGEVLDMMAFSTKKGEANQNYVYVSIKITLIKRTKILKDNPIILNEVYPFKIVRKNNSVKSIPDAFSRAWSQVAHQILVDVHNAIESDIKGNV